MDRLVLDKTVADLMFELCPIPNGVLELIDGEMVFNNCGLHNEHGPAIKLKNGVNTWALNNKLLTEVEWKIAMRDKKIRKILSDG